MTQILHPVRYVERMPLGYSKPQRILFSDDREYVVKFKNNPSGTRVLVNEYVVGSLADLLSLPVVPFEIVSIPRRFIKSHSQLSSCQFQSGNAFASLYIKNCKQLDNHFVPPGNLEIVNRDTLAGIIVFDQWTSNSDRKMNNLLLERMGHNRYRLYIIDHGHCFSDAKWNIRTLKRLPKIRFREQVHKFLFIMQGRRKVELTAFMEKIMALPEKRINEVIQSIPDDWHVSKEERDALSQHLLDGRMRLRRFYVSRKT